MCPILRGALLVLLLTALEIRAPASGISPASPEDSLPCLETIAFLKGTYGALCKESLELLLPLLPLSIDLKVGARARGAG